MHDLETERSFKPAMINGMMALAAGPIKTMDRNGSVPAGVGSVRVMKGSGVILPTEASLTR